MWFCFPRVSNHESLSLLALASTHLPSPSLGRVEAEQRGFGEGDTGGGRRPKVPMDPAETRKLVSDPPEGG